MKRIITLAVLTLCLAELAESFGQNEPPKGKHLQFSLVFYTGDPLGSREEGTLQCIAQPYVVTLEGRPFSIVSGGQIPVRDVEDKVKHLPYGYKFEGVPGKVKDGVVPVELTLSKITIQEQNEKDERVQLHTVSTRLIVQLKLGETRRIRWLKDAADKQTWLELTVDENR